MSIFGKAVYQIMIVSVVWLPQTAAAQNLRKLAREQAIRNPGALLEQPAPPAEYLPKTIEELAKEADVVLVGRLSRINSYLSPKEDRILTDYGILESRVIAGRLPAVSTRLPGPGVPLILTVYGGDVVVEGVRIRGTDNNREAITDGRQYVLFLRESRRKEPWRYEIYYGGVFEIAHEEVKPLLKGADAVFKGTVDPRLKNMILRIQTARQNR